jgi:sugar-specific transcriptional regulator TrmB
MEKMQSLQKLGLSKNEITVYTYLLTRGSSLGNEIYQENHLDKSSSYKALDGLIAKGLVYQIGQTRNRKFVVHGVGSLEKLYEQKQAEIDEIRSGLDDFIKNIDEVVEQSYKFNNITVYEGKDAYENWRNTRFTAKGGSTIRQLVSWELHSTYIKNYKSANSDLVNQRVNLGIKMRSLIPQSEVITNPLDKTDLSKLKEVRRIPGDFVVNSSFMTFNNKVGLLSRKNGRILGIIIEDSLVTSLLNNMFDFIWRQSREI